MLDRLTVLGLDTGAAGHGAGLMTTVTLVRLFVALVAMLVHLLPVRVGIWARIGR